MKITIDSNSGFCFGVVYAIQKAEEELEQSGSLYCLGDIVHNNKEVERLSSKGLKVIDHEKLNELHDCKVLIRAHGEPPETYQIALKNNIDIGWNPRSGFHHLRKLRWNHRRRVRLLVVPPYLLPT